MAIIERSPSDGTAVPPPRPSLWRALLWPRRDAGPRRASRAPWVPIAIISVIVVMALFLFGVDTFLAWIIKLLTGRADG